MPTPGRTGGWHGHGWGCAGFTWQRGPCPADLPCAVQAAQPGRALPKTPGITPGTKTGEGWPENLARQVESGAARSRRDRFGRRTAPPQSFLQTACAPGPVLPRPDRLDVSPCSGHRTPRGCLGKAAAEARGAVGGRQSRAPPGSVCPASCHPPAQP